MVSINNYLEVYMPEHHRATTNGYVYEHILVAEKILGRPLKPEEVVHHKDLNRSNNSMENILIFATISDHSAFHKTGYYFLDNDGIAHSKKLRFFCKYCGKEVSYGYDKCSKCCQFLQRRIERPDRETLKKLIKTLPFTKIAKMYGVSDNAIRKWCKALNLPHRTIDINSYSDEQWIDL